AFIVEKEEQPISHKTSAEVGAELILNVLRLRNSSAIIEEVVGVEDSIAQKLVRGPVIRITAALCRNADQRTRATAVLSRIRIGAHLELLNRVHRWAHDLGRQLLNVFRNRVVVHAVEDEVVLQRAHSVDVGSAGAS